VSQLRPLGDTGLRVTPIGMGCWPIAGVTSIDVNEADSLATLQAALDGGINFFDTAYCYGYTGESERLVGRVLRGVRDRVVIATKGGIHWNADRKQVRDGSPATLRRECDESLSRLGFDFVDLLYLHAPDPETPLRESAAALRGLMEAGKTRSVGVSNFNVPQLDEFSRECPIAAVQPHFNMLQREIEADVLPWCVRNNAACVVYWPLMKGLLAGKLPRDHQFDPRDGRRKYPMFFGDEWNRNQDFLDQLRPIASECGKTVSQLVLNWTIHQPGITVALCGAKRAHQIADNAGGMGWTLTEDQMARINAAIAARGETVSRGAV
jgi:aryl-alcohol dehydrogenase-like predicted oxidoreductase